MALLNIMWADCSKKHVTYSISTNGTEASWFYRIDRELAKAHLFPYYKKASTHYVLTSKTVFEAVLSAIAEKETAKKKRRRDD
jgi:hypothetical protein